jgi:hypothetical protein
MTELYKLINGEELIGVTIESDEYNYVVKNPLILQFIDNEDSMSGMILVNYIPFCMEDFIRISRDTVVAKIPVNSSLAEYYEKSVLYNEKVTSKKMNQSLALATTYLDQMLDSIEELESKPKQSIAERKKKFVVVSSTPTSNTIN